MSAWLPLATPCYPLLPLATLITSYSSQSASGVYLGQPEETRAAAAAQIALQDDPSLEKKFEKSKKKEEKISRRQWKRT
tara:strand:- start:622 stop:858 length:237 start_codon:yes stop_codon:yes gene_type:complete